MSELPDNNYEESRRWLRNVQADIRPLDAVLRDPESPGRIGCFLAHLAIEKALKATLIDLGVPFKKTHDLVGLHKMCRDARRLETLNPEQLGRLNPWAIDGRYADDLKDATRAQAIESGDLAKAVVAAVEAEFQRNRGGS